jgi:SAM-dependent methyltransferase
MTQTPDFSLFADRYAQGRPRYPPALFAWLASRVDRHELAWDCGTGNGQAAVGLVDHFARVIATDRSAEQLRHAAPHPRIEYRAEPAELSGLADASVDLVTAAAAVHWLDLPAFAAEVRRVARPGGVLAVWTYHPARVSEPFEPVLSRFYWRLKPWFAGQTDLVDAAYTTLELPGTPIPAPAFEVVVEWTLAELRAFLTSFSGVQVYLGERGEDPLEWIAGELAELWGDPASRRRLSWPLALRAQRL